MREAARKSCLLSGRRGDADHLLVVTPTGHSSGRSCRGYPGSRRPRRVPGLNSPNESNNDAFGSGAVYVFSRSGKTWSQKAYIKPSNTQDDEAFGDGLSLYNDILAVGAAQESSSATGINSLNQGIDFNATTSCAVYVFLRSSGGTWAQRGYVKASNTGKGDFFGRSVSVSSDVLAVGAPSESSKGTGASRKATTPSVVVAPSTSTENGCCVGCLMEVASIAAESLKADATRAGRDGRSEEIGLARRSALRWTHIP